MTNNELFIKMSKNAIEYYKNFSWDKSALKFKKIIDLYLEGFK
ncbi:hypothetical protein MJ1_0350 [Nanobdella aerobiophila]|uniref:Uncharacterized protein n=1 Tax=Nanobdella aerobiophila TaxID=2586965 RepID=A0A915SZX1_9ARCH|nr:hypothetical protein MJ1_0350 [Nanobdella aerobiophila]